MCDRGGRVLDPKSHAALCLNTLVAETPSKSRRNGRQTRFPGAELEDGVVYTAVGVVVLVAGALQFTTWKARSSRAASHSGYGSCGSSSFLYLSCCCRGQTERLDHAPVESEAAARDSPLSSS
jgi:hypothetical protein